jgi:hypothetical protein
MLKGSVTEIIARSLDINMHGATVVKWRIKEGRLQAIIRFSDDYRRDIEDTREYLRRIAQKANLLGIDFIVIQNERKTKHQ